jgi:hypothetical protein
MARIPRPLLKLLDETLHDNERVIWQARPDVWTGLKMWRFMWWVGVPWMIFAIVAADRGWIDDSASFFLMTGIGILAIPIVVNFQSLRTLFVITDRRALILRSGWGEKRSADSTWYDEMNKELEVLPVMGHVGHLNFASGASTRSPDADYTGRYGFHFIKNVEKVRAVLEQALAR